MKLYGVNATKFATLQNSSLLGGFWRFLVENGDGNAVCHKKISRDEIQWKMTVLRVLRSECPAVCEKSGKRYMVYSLHIKKWKSMKISEISGILYLEWQCSTSDNVVWWLLSTTFENSINSLQLVQEKLLSHTAQRMCQIRVVIVSVVQINLWLLCGIFWRLQYGYRIVRRTAHFAFMV